MDIFADDDEWIIDIGKIHEASFLSLRWFRA